MCVSMDNLSFNVLFRGKCSMLGGSSALKKENGGGYRHSNFLIWIVNLVVCSITAAAGVAFC